MRIKTLKRNTTNVIKRAAEALQARAGQINLNFNVLLRQQKEVERELDEEREASSGDGAVGGRTSATTSMTDSFRSQLVHKRSVIKEAILRRSQEVVAIEVPSTQHGHATHTHAHACHSHLLTLASPLLPTAPV